ncbi:Transcription initiation factor TFIID subunit 9 [Sporothrix curviconia]|uniref:Transcription initiation factor TFIID subunit 9 n=1 Tax=Sporothrix curviconia TaxID=1260050 RepID=A0ABP0B3V5_9PEZI
MASVAFQTNGAPPTGTANSASRSQDNTQTSQPPSTQTASQPSQSTIGGPGAAAASSQTQPPPSSQQQQPDSATQPAPKPRDARTMELLLTAQGVTAYETRVPQLLLDFAYRHTSSVLSDAIHLSADPYTSHAGSKPSASSGAAAMAPAGGDASVSANAVQLAIASRLAFQFRGGAGGASAGGGASKEWLLELARERNKVALPRVGAVEWGARLPSERFVLSGVSWGLRDAWAPGAAAAEDDDDGDDDGDDDDERETMESAMLGKNNKAVAGADSGDVTMTDGATAAEDVGGDGVEGGTMDDVFADDDMEDEEMGMD